MDERKKRPTDGLRKRVERERDEKRAMMMGGMEWQESERAKRADAACAPPRLVDRSLVGQVSPLLLHFPFYLRRSQQGPHSQGNILA